MKRFAIVPVKSRSTRLPRKNFLDLAGIPMFVRVLNVLRESQLFDEIWVSADEDVSSYFQFTGPFKCLDRHPALAKDTSTVNQVCQNWLSALKVKPDYFCCVYATAVFLRPEDINAAWNQFDENTDSVMGVSEYNYPPVQALTRNDKGYSTPLFPDWVDKQSQSFPETFVSNGTQYWFKTSAYLTEKSFYLPNTRPYLTHESRVLDINTPEDFVAAQIRASQLGWS